MVEYAYLKLFTANSKNDYKLHCHRSLSVKNFRIIDLRVLLSLYEINRK
jgi:hypothetical protein